MIDFHSPIVHFHVLSVEKKNCGRDVTNVEVSCVNRRFIYINDIDGRHITKVMGGFWKLKSTKGKDGVNVFKWQQMKQEK